jgi:hypothetical protein
MFLALTLFSYLTSLTCLVFGVYTQGCKLIPHVVYTTLIKNTSKIDLSSFNHAPKLKSQLNMKCVGLRSNDLVPVSNKLDVRENLRTGSMSTYKNQKAQSTQRPALWQSTSLACAGSGLILSTAKEKQMEIESSVVCPVSFPSC